MSVTKWGKEVAKLTKAARISQARLASESDVYPMALSRYLGGKFSRPDPQTVLTLNRKAAELVGLPAIEPHLDLLALQDGLLKLDAFDAEAMVDCLEAALDHLGAGLLVADWREGLAAWALTHRGPAIEKLVIAVNRAYRELLLSDIHGKVPASRGYAALRNVLDRHGLANLIAEGTSARDGIDRFRNTVRQILDRLGGPNMEARERLAAEAALLVAALKLSNPEVTGLQLALAGFMPKMKGTK